MRKNIKNKMSDKKPRTPNTKIFSYLKKREAEKARNEKLEKVVKPEVKKITDVDYIFREFSAEVRKKTQELYKVAADFLRYSSDRSVLAGKLMREIKAELDHGKWIEWVELNLYFDIRSAQNAMKAADFADANPATYHKVRRLGTSKLYEISRQHPAIQNKLTRKDTFRLVGKKAMTLQEMTFEETRDLIKSMKGIPAFIPEHHVKGMKRGLNGILGKIEEYEEKDGMYETEDVTEMLGTLEKLTKYFMKMR